MNAKKTQSRAPKGNRSYTSNNKPEISLKRRRVLYLEDVAEHRTILDAALHHERVQALLSEQAAPCFRAVCAVLGERIPANPDGALLTDLYNLAHALECYARDPEGEAFKARKKRLAIQTRALKKAAEGLRAYRESESGHAPVECDSGGPDMQGAGRSILPGMAFAEGLPAMIEAVETRLETLEVAAVEYEVTQGKKSKPGTRNYEQKSVRIKKLPMVRLAASVVIVMKRLNVTDTPELMRITEALIDAVGAPRSKAGVRSCFNIPNLRSARKLSAQ